MGMRQGNLSESATTAVDGRSIARTVCRTFDVDLARRSIPSSKFLRTWKKQLVWIHSRTNNTIWEKNMLQSHSPFKTITRGKPLRRAPEAQKIVQSYYFNRYFWSVSQKNHCFSMCLVSPSWHTSISTNNMEMLSPNGECLYYYKLPNNWEFNFQKEKFCKLKNDFAPS